MSGLDDRRTSVPVAAPAEDLVADRTQGLTSSSSLRHHQESDGGGGGAGGVSRRGNSGHADPKRTVPPGKKRPLPDEDAGGADDPDDRPTHRRTPSSKKQCTTTVTVTVGPTNTALTPGTDVDRRDRPGDQRPRAPDTSPSTGKAACRDDTDDVGLRGGGTDGRLGSSSGYTSSSSTIGGGTEEVTEEVAAAVDVGGIGGVGAGHGNATAVRSKTAANWGEAKKKGLWTTDEDNRLIALVNEHGPKKWSSLANKLDADRTAKQCRERWTHQLDPAIKRGPWTEEEDEAILKAYGEMGSQWAKIAKVIGTTSSRRTGNDIKNRWNTVLKPEKKRKVEERDAKKKREAEEQEAKKQRKVEREAEKQRINAMAPEERKAYLVKKKAEKEEERRENASVARAAYIVQVAQRSDAPSDVPSDAPSPNQATSRSAAAVVAAVMEAIRINNGFKTKSKSISDVPAEERERISRLRASEVAGNLPLAILRAAVDLGVPENHLLPSLSDKDHLQMINFYFSYLLIIIIIKWCIVKNPLEYFMGVLKVGLGVIMAISSIAVKTMRERLPFIKLYNGLLRRGSVRGFTFGVGTCSHPMFVPHFLHNLHLAMEDRHGKFYSVLNEDSPVEGISVGKFLLLLFAIMIQDRLKILGDWTFCFGLLIRHLIGPDGCFNVAAILSVREVCFFAKLRKGSMYYLEAVQRLFGSKYDNMKELLKGESNAAMAALLDAAQQAYDQSLPLQLIAEAGVDPDTEEAETTSFVINLCRKPAESKLTDSDYHSLPIKKKLVEHLTYGPASLLLACFVESTHTQGPNAHNFLARPMYWDRSWIQYEEGFSIDDEGHTIDRNDWEKALTNVFVERTAETFYLIQFSARVVAPASRESQVIVPKGELVGLAHAFLPSDSDGFATEILKKASDDSFLVIKV